MQVRCVDSQSTEFTNTFNIGSESSGSEICSQPAKIDIQILSDTVCDSGADKDDCTKNFELDGHDVLRSVQHYNSNTSASDIAVLSDYSDIDRILIVDNIDKALEFSSSQRILREINRYCAEVKIDFAYSLAKGGVAIHTNSKEDRNLLLDVLPAESFGGGVKHPPRNNKDSTAYIKGIDTSVSVQRITDSFLDKGIQLTYIRRLTKRFSGKPIQVVKVKCSETLFDKLLNTKLVINNKVCVTEKRRAVKVIRCYNCQRFGHIAKNCKNDTKGEFCAQSHSISDICVCDVHCANCSGNHPSSSSLCPAYLKRYETISTLHAEYLHLPSSVATCGTKTSN